MTTKQKRWLTSNFRLTIDGLDCSKVSSISDFSIKQNYAQDTIGVTRELELIPTTLEFPNLSVTFSASSAVSWKKWFDEFVVKGNNDDSMEKSGAIDFLAPNLQDSLLTVNLSNVGIFSLKPESSADLVQRMTAELYCEIMSLKFEK